MTNVAPLEEFSAELDTEDGRMLVNDHVRAKQISEKLLDARKLIEQGTALLHEAVELARDDYPGQDSDIRDLYGCATVLGNVVTVNAVRWSAATEDRQGTAIRYALAVRRGDVS